MRGPLTDNSELLQAALFYATERGWHVFPCDVSTQILELVGGGKATAAVELVARLDKETR